MNVLGTSKEELAHCDSLYTIATTKEYGSLNLAMATGVVMYQLAREAKSIQPYADGTDIKPEPIISTSDVNQRTNELLDTISQTGIFDNGKDQRSHAEVYLRKILMRARLTGFESRWLRRMTMRLQAHLRSGVWNQIDTGKEHTIIQQKQEPLTISVCLPWFLQSRGAPCFFGPSLFLSEQLLPYSLTMGQNVGEQRIASFPQLLVVH